MSEPGAVIVERHGRCRVHRLADAPLEQVLEALRVPGTPLKCSRKFETRRVGGWVVKKSLPRPVSVLKHALHPSRYRAGWLASLHLTARGILVPRPRAFVEHRRLGLVTSNAFICDYLDGWVNVEDHARSLVRQEAPPESIAAFLERLADAVNALNDAGAFHTDLSGKNIFTQDGRQFCFIDLDGVVLGKTYTRPDRLLNHVQLYDSFCDWWPDSLLEPFIERMLPEGRDTAGWMDDVRAAQALRRARTEAVWRRQGRLPA